ncbi:hypothetical protein C4571_01960 [Candidatus Parcubacteria bacterium]|nr:MAG: hypothetical protein C4571_01960 [Candidatus Parcubacteria bacterium]
MTKPLPSKPRRATRAEVEQERTAKERLLEQLSGYEIANQELRKLYSTSQSTIQKLHEDLRQEERKSAQLQRTLDALVAATLGRRP